MSKFDRKFFRNTNFLKNINRHPRWGYAKRYFSHHPRELIASLLMVIGIVLAFFYSQMGGLFVGVAAGIGFFDESLNYLFKLRSYYIQQGLFKTLMLVGVSLYFLIMIPAFIIAFGITFGIQCALRLTFH